MFENIYLKNVTTLRLLTFKCNGCGMCLKVCPHQVFNIVNGKSRITNADKCMECGACARNCSQGAIMVKAGVGCATAVINAILRKTDPICGYSTENPVNCSGEKSSNCC